MKTKCTICYPHFKYPKFKNAVEGVTGPLYPQGEIYGVTLPCIMSGGSFGVQPTGATGPRGGDYGVYVGGVTGPNAPQWSGILPSGNNNFVISASTDIASPKIMVDQIIKHGSDPVSSSDPVGTPIAVESIKDLTTQLLNLMNKVVRDMSIPELMSPTDDSIPIDSYAANSDV